MMPTVCMLIPATANLTANARTAPNAIKNMLKPIPIVLATPNIKFLTLILVVPFNKNYKPMTQTAKRLWNYVTN